MAEGNQASCKTGHGQGGAGRRSAEGPAPWALRSSQGLLHTTRQGLPPQECPCPDCRHSRRLRSPSEAVSQSGPQR